LPPEQKFLVERRFRLPASPGKARESTLTWEDLASDPVVVVLGDPGAGKSTELEREASRTPDAVFFSIRRFLRAPDQDLQAGTLFLDALDEMRASGSNQHEVLDRVIQRLNQLGRPKVRLSCRAADWFGELDRSELASASPSGKVKVVELQPLTEGDVEQIVQADLEDPSAFLDMVRRQRLEDWLGNPQTLDLMIEVARKGDLPQTRTELLEKACALMASEENRTHRQAKRGPIGQQETLEAAGFLSTMVLLAGLGGFASDKDESDTDFPWLNEIPYSQEELRATIESRLFRWQEGRAVPVHRTIAEFLVARTVRDRIRNGLPLTRVLRLITGHDGGTLSDLRGMYAWLTTLTPEHAAVLASRDPMALIFYGDPEPLPPFVKQTVLEGLEKLARQDPWFFYEGGSAQTFGGLVDPALIPDFRTVLTEPDRPHYLRLSVLAALAYGHPLPGLQEDLRKIVYDRDSPQGIRELALKALINVVSDSAQLRSILEDVQGGTVLDEEDNLRAQLLKRLYPQAIDARNVSDYLTAPKTQWRLGAYYFFLTQALASKTLEQSIPDLMDSLCLADSCRRLREYDVWEEIAGPLLVRALEAHGESVPVGRLRTWLQLGVDEFNQSVLKGKHQKAIRDWFSDRPERTTELYQWWLRERAASNSEIWHSDFWSSLCTPDIPSTLWRWQLSMAESWTGGKKGEDLFRAVISATWQGASGPSLEEIYAWTDRHPMYRNALELISIVDLPKRYFDPARVERLQQERTKKQTIKEDNKAFIEERLGLVTHLFKPWNSWQNDSFTSLPRDPRDLTLSERSSDPK